jgi:hypothetical protein
VLLSHGNALRECGSKPRVEEGSATFDAGKESRPISLATAPGALVPYPSSLVIDEAQLKSLLPLLLKFALLSSSSPWMYRKNKPLNHV